MKNIFFPNRIWDNDYWEMWSWDVSDIEVWATTNTIQDMYSHLEKDERVGWIQRNRQQITFTASRLISKDEWYECVKEFMDKFNGGDMLYLKKE